MKIRSRRLNKTLAVLAAWGLRAWLWTCKVDVRAEPGTSPFAGRLGEPGRRKVSGRCRAFEKIEAGGPHVPAFFPFWHEWVVLHVFTRPHAAMAGLVSKHRDGGYLADAMTAAGLHTVRGSSSRGGAGAVKHIIEDGGGYDLGITPDGPRGPRRTMKDGVAFLASRTGRPVVTTAVVCSRPWVLKGSWTDLVLPRPFSTVVFRGGPARTIRPDATREEMRAFCDLLERDITEQEDRARLYLETGEDRPAAVAEPPAVLRKAA